MLKLLSEKDKYWREIALSICKDKSLSDEIVQEMYLRLMNNPNAKYTGYVINTIKTLHSDYHRWRKRVNEVELNGYNYAVNETIFEPTDEEQKVLDRYKEITFYQQEFIEESYDKSLRQIESHYDEHINYGYIHRQTHIGLKHILGKEEEGYKNKRLKHNNKN